MRELDLLQWFFIVTSSASFIANMFGFFSFLETVIGDKSSRDIDEIVRKVAILSFGFIVSLVLLMIGRAISNATNNFETTLKVFSTLYFVLSWLALIISSVIFKLKRLDLNHYIMFGFIALVPYLYSLILAMLIGYSLRNLSSLFYAALAIQVIFIIGKYILKHLLSSKGYEISSSIIAEYPIAFKIFCIDAISLPKLIMSIEQSNFITKENKKNDSENVLDDYVQGEYFQEDIEKLMTYSNVELSEYIENLSPETYKVFLNVLKQQDLVKIIDNAVPKEDQEENSGILKIDYFKFFTYDVAFSFLSLCFAITSSIINEEFIIKILS